MTYFLHLLSTCPITRCMYLEVVWWLACLSDPQSYVSGSLALLAGSTKLEQVCGVEARVCTHATLEVGRCLPYGWGVKHASMHYDKYDIYMESLSCSFPAQLKLNDCIFLSIFIKKKMHTANSFSNFKQLHQNKLQWKHDGWQVCKHTHKYLQSFG